MIIKSWLVSLLCCCMVVSSCTTLYNVPRSSGSQTFPRSSVKRGDTVMITMRDGTDHELKVQQVDAEALTGRARSGAKVERYAFADIQTLRVRQVSIGNTAGAVGAALAVVGAVVLAVYYHALTHGEEE